MTIAIHVTHEAIGKIGGIGAVLEGLLPTPIYQKTFPTTLLYTPLFTKDALLENRLGDNAEVLYSSIDKYDSDHWSDIFAPIQSMYGIHIVYGKKTYQPAGSQLQTVTDILAVDIADMTPKSIDAFKYALWQHFQFRSDKYSADTDFEQFLRLGIPLTAILDSLYPEQAAHIFSHEYMGMPSALAIKIAQKNNCRMQDKTIFYAHEICTARSIVENHPGHDLSFYNLLNADTSDGISMEDEFESFAHYSRSELVKLACELDHIYAVSDITKREYQYLCPHVDIDKIHTVYNGISYNHIPYKEKQKSQRLIKTYCESLFNFKPDFIFTHVTRLVPSKAIWRDIRLLESLDKHFAANRKKGVFILLSTLMGNGRCNDDVHQMEFEYGWPVLHKEGWPDLVYSEVDIYRSLEIFNARSQAIKGVFLNQFGFDRLRCGMRIPEKANFLHLRQASDLEFGMSIYEPFGIAQLETLPYGGRPVVSSVCGCASLLKQHMENNDHFIIDFTKVPAKLQNAFQHKNDYKHISTQLRDLVETEICNDVSGQLFEALPHNQISRQAIYEHMQDYAKRLDWNEIAVNVCSPFSK